MAILIDINLPQWMKDETLRDVLAPQLPDTRIYCGRPTQQLPDVIMLAVADHVADIWAYLPNLKLVQKLGAGVNMILDDPKLPAQIRITRLAPDSQVGEIAEYCLLHVLRYQRNTMRHEADAAVRKWGPMAPRQTLQTTVGVLGLGRIGAHTAQLFASLGFRVLGWSRTPKSLDKVDCRAGDKALPELVAQCDYIVSILPSTPPTKELFDSELISRMKPGAVFINTGRGDVIVDDALVAALDSGRLGGAVLDVFRQEPLPPDHPFWGHPLITVTPHVSGWHVDENFTDVAENYRRLRDGRALLHEVERKLGY